MIPQSLSRFIVERPKADWRSFGDLNSPLLKVLRFADQKEQEAAFEKAGIVARDGQTLPPDFSWPGIGDISVIGQVMDQPPVYGKPGMDGLPTIEKEATYLDGWFVNVLVSPPAERSGDTPPPPRTIIDGVTFLGRVTDQEYAAVLAAARQSPQIARWLDILRLRGEVDVAGSTAQAAKAGLVAAGLLTPERADAIFAAG
jgi:hypothetical protein